MGEGAGGRLAHTQRARSLGTRACARLPRSPHTCSKSPGPAPLLCARTATPPPFPAPALRKCMCQCSFRRSCSAHQHIISAEQDVPALLQRTAAHSLRRKRCSGTLAAHIRKFSAQEYHSTPPGNHTLNRHGHICTWGHFWAMHYPWE